MGGAIGDALGYPAEFMKYDEIIDKYGEKGVNELKLTNGFAQISDDTQMTLYTANAVIREKTNRLMSMRLRLSAKAGLPKKLLR